MVLLELCHLPRPYVIKHNIGKQNGQNRAVYRRQQWFIVGKPPVFHLILGLCLYFLNKGLESERAIVLFKNTLYICTHKSDSDDVRAQKRSCPRRNVCIFLWQILLQNHRENEK